MGLGVRSLALKVNFLRRFDAWFVAATFDVALVVVAAPPGLWTEPSAPIFVLGALTMLELSETSGMVSYFLSKGSILLELAAGFAAAVALLGIGLFASRAYYC